MDHEAMVAIDAVKKRRRDAVISTRDIGRETEIDARRDHEEETAVPFGLAVQRIFLDSELETTSQAKRGTSAC